MARYNKIYAGPVSEPLPHASEGILNGAYMPGTAVIRSAANFAQAGANSNEEILILQDNYLALKGVDDAWLSGDRGVALRLLDDELFNVRVPTGNSLVAGVTKLTTTATGRFAIATTGQRIIAIAAETYNNNTGSDQLVRVRPAKSHLPAA